MEQRAALDTDVLVVDDNDATRAAMANVLRCAGYRVVEAEDGFVALAHLRVGSVGAVVLDIDVPGLDGLSLLELLDDPPPVVMVMASSYDPRVARRSDKIFAFVDRPVRVENLLDLIGRALARSEVDTSPSE